MGISESEISHLCYRAKVRAKYDNEYDSAARCPVLGAVMMAVGDLPVPDKIIPTGVYTVGMTAAALDMSRSAVRRLVKSGQLAAVADSGGYLILGSDILQFLTGGIAVLGKGRRGVKRLPSWWV